MKQVVVTVVFLLLVATAALAQEGVNVYICENNVGCNHGATSGRISATDAEIAIGQSRPSETASVVCDTSHFCTWTDLSEGEIELVYGGDGEIERYTDTDTTPIEIDFDITEAIDLFNDPADPDTLNFPVIVCDETRCKHQQTLITRAEAEIVLGETVPDGDFYVRCDADGCGWQLREGDDDEVATACSEPATGVWTSPPGTFSGSCPAFLRSFIPSLASFTSDEVGFPQPFNMRSWIAQNDPGFDFAGVEFGQPSVCEYTMSIQEAEGGFVYTMDMKARDQLAGRMEMNFRSPDLTCDLIVDFEFSLADE